MNNRETIEGVEGEWRTVTKPSEVAGWQRVRYDGCFIGFNGKPRYVFTIGEKVSTTCGYPDGPHCDNLFCNEFKNTVQAFFPLPAKQKRKVAKVTIKKGAYYRVWFKLDRMCKFTPEFAYSSRKSALRGAKRFCKSIGYEMEVAK